MILKPNQPIEKHILQSLNALNAKLSQTQDHAAYIRDLQTLFQVRLSPVKTNRKAFLGGFCAGEASLTVSAKRNRTSKFGLIIKPEFNLTQHVNGMEMLILALDVFQSGRLRFKTGSLATFVVSIYDPEALRVSVKPFYKVYVLPFCGVAKYKRSLSFFAMCHALKRKRHAKLDGMVRIVLPLWSRLRLQNHTNQTFANLKEAQTYVLNFEKRK